MFHFLQILTAILIAGAGTGPCPLSFLGKCAHKEAYFAMQSIYYPGFTIGGGIGEFGGNCTLILLLFYTFGGVQNSG